jgi:hypothetical protein
MNNDIDAFVFKWVAILFGLGVWIVFQHPWIVH